MLAPAVPVWAASSDPGPLRDCNEDRWLVDADARLYALADGMGGFGAGEVAAETAVRVLIEAAAGALRTGLSPADALTRATDLAHSRIVAAAKARPECLGMGSTLVAAAVSGERLTVAHVGDSRAYLLHGTEWTLLTQDHCLRQPVSRPDRLSAAAQRRIEGQAPLTRALGAGDQQVALPQVSEWAWHDADLLLLCSDGLSDVLDSDSIRDLLVSRFRKPGPDLQSIAQALVQAALAAGGRDNVTALLVQAQPARA